MRSGALCFLCLLAVAGLSLEASARQTTLQAVRQAPNLRAALAQAKKLPQVRQALSAGKRLVLARRTPTESEGSRGQFKSACSGRYEFAGYTAELALIGGPLGPKAQLTRQSRWVLGYDPPGARALPSDGLASQFADATRRERGYQSAPENTWIFQNGPEHRHAVPTWRNSKSLRMTAGAFHELGPAQLADALSKSLAANASR